MLGIFLGMLHTPLTVAVSATDVAEWVRCLETGGSQTTVTHARILNHNQLLCGHMRSGQRMCSSSLCQRARLTTPIFLPCPLHQVLSTWAPTSCHGVIHLSRRSAAYRLDATITQYSRDSKVEIAADGDDRGEGVAEEGPQAGPRPILLAPEDGGAHVQVRRSRGGQGVCMDGVSFFCLAGCVGRCIRVG